MTDLIKALADGAALLSRLGEMVERVEAHTRALDRLQERMNHVTISLERLEDRVQRIGVETHDQISVNHDYGIRIQTLEERTLDDPEFERLLKRVNILEENGDGGEDLEDRIGEILDRKLDHVLEDAVTEALSGREITICL